MLRTDLSTRPFYNERGVRAGLGALALVALGLTAFNAVELLRLEREGREARQAVAQNAEQARELLAQARIIRQSINQTQLAAVQAQAREANGLIDRRAFSWTELLNHFQATLPADVRITRVTPQVDDDGRMLVAVTAYARRVDDLNEFIEALEATGAFTGALSRQDEVEEDGTWRSEVQAYYGPPPPEASARQAPPPPEASARQAVPPASASEPGGAQ
jgi:hypothetical protein